jgi:hypothetical protein
VADNLLQRASVASQREHLLLRRAAGYPAGVEQLPDKLGAIEAAVRVFRELSVPHALIGGLAVGIRSGVPRATLDVDFAIASTADRDRLCERMAARGFRLVGTSTHLEGFVSFRRRSHPSLCCGGQILKRSHRAPVRAAA